MLHRYRVTTDMWEDSDYYGIQRIKRSIFDYAGNQIDVDIPVDLFDNNLGDKEEFCKRSDVQEGNPVAKTPTYHLVHNQYHVNRNTNPKMKLPSRYVRKPLIL